MWRGYAKLFTFMGSSDCCDSSKHPQKLIRNCDLSGGSLHTRKYLWFVKSSFAYTHLFIPQQFSPTHSYWSPKECFSSECLLKEVKIQGSQSEQSSFTYTSLKGTVAKTLRLKNCHVKMKDVHKTTQYLQKCKKNVEYGFFKWLYDLECTVHTTVPNRAFSI